MKHFDEYGNPVGDVKEPLEIPREALIGVLQENLATEQAEREEKAEKVNAKLAEFKDFLHDHQDEVAGYVAQLLGWTGSWEDSLTKITRLFEDGHFEPTGVKPSSKENALEKYVRVLSLASNKAISITPDDELYPLL